MLTVTPCVPCSFVPTSSQATPGLTGAAAIDLVVSAVIGEMTAHGFGDRDVFAMRLSLEEALVNAIKHGNKFDTTREMTLVWEVGEDAHYRVRLCWAHERRTVRVGWTVGEASVLVLVRDNGDGFNPDLVADPTVAENLERPCGRGLLLMRHYMTWIRYFDRGRGVLLYRKRLSPSQ